MSTQERQSEAIDLATTMRLTGIGRTHRYVVADWTTPALRLQLSNGSAWRRISTDGK